MAQTELRSSTDLSDQNRTIPVFTVLKNNAILKNIFLIIPIEPSEMQNLDKDEILTVGRHPNCSIVLSHPSISRFHLQIKSKPNLRKLSVSDLSSVHGTWVCGKRLRPRDCVELNEGDELRLGGSSRVYKLHWVSACQAYDLKNPFCPSSDLSVGDDVQNHEEESLSQNESGLMTDDDEDASLKLEAKTSLLSCGEIQLQGPVTNGTALKGILKHPKEYSHCIVKPLSFPLPDEGMLKVNEVGGIDVQKQFNSPALVPEVASGIRIEYSQMVEYDEQVSESCTEELKVTVEDCSQALEACINADGVLPSQESQSDMGEKQSLLGEDQAEMPVDSTKEHFGIIEESSLKETEKGINQSVTTRQTLKPDLTLGELFISEDLERIDAMFKDICEYPVVDNEAPKITPAGAELTTYPQMSDEAMHSKLERVSTEFVLDIRSINDEGDVKPEDGIQLSEMDTQSLQLIVNSASTLETTEENVAIKSGNGGVVSDSGIQILEPHLDSFVFTEKDTKESCGLTSKLEQQSPKTPFGAKSIPFMDIGKGSTKISRQISSIPKVSSQKCQRLSVLKTVSCNCKSKRRGSTTLSGTPLRNVNGDEKSVSKIHFDNGEEKYEICTPDKENCSHRSQPLRSVKKKGILGDIEFSSSTTYTSHSKKISHSSTRKVASKVLRGDQENVEYEVEMYTPDKENFTPNTRLLKSMKRMGLFDENKLTSSVSDNSYSLGVSNSPLPQEKIYGSASAKENNTPFLGQEQSLPSVQKQSGNKKTLVSVQRKAERVPLQSLSTNSSCRSKPDAPSVNKASATSRGSVTRPQFQRKNSPIKNKIELEPKLNWCMVADTTCFVDNESLKSLKLLQGLRGTKLIVPGTVLRELDAMKQQASFFRRETEVSEALKWLEDCLVNTKWWIHIQDSSEEERHLLPTPPASPTLVYSTRHNGKVNWKTCSLFQTLSVLSTPKTEDHVLEYALQKMRSIDGNQRISILSKDTSLRIKAIAQGLICETATEFRDSLVNPFSERFLWSESSPRGRTWSCHDDIVLRELFYSQSSKSQSRGHETIKGLKLVIAYDESSRGNKTASSLH